MSVERPEKEPEHATRGIANRQIAMGAFAAVVGVLGAVFANGVLAINAIWFGAVFLGLGFYVRSAGAATVGITGAVASLAEGKLDEAEARLDRAATRSHARYIRRQLEYVRARLALRRGDIAGARAHADAAVCAPLGWFRTIERARIAEVRGLRAFLRASGGDGSGARDDIGAVRSSEHASATALAYACLGEAMLLEQTGDRPALRSLLRRERRLLIENTEPRERAIVRAYQRMLATQEVARSAYRVGAPREEARVEPPLAQWMALVAPGAAAFASGVLPGASPPHPHDEPILASASPADVRAAEARLAPSGTPTWMRRVILVYVALVALVGMALGIWTSLAPRPSHRVVVHAPAPESTLLATVLTASAFPIVLLGAIALTLARSRKATRAYLAAVAKTVRGDEEAGEKELIELARAKAFSTAAVADLALALLACRRADFAGALARCDHGIARAATKQQRAALSDVLFPALLTQRAYALAALGRASEAAAEVQLLARDYPRYIALQKAQTSVALMSRAHAGDAKGAARVAEKIGESSLGCWDETLADLARVVASPASAGAAEVARLEDEIRGDPEVRRWVEATAPELLAALGRARVAPPAGEVEAEAEREAAAIVEEEAEMERRAVLLA